MHSRYNELHFLYYRKGIAEYFLGDCNYLDSLNKAIFLLKISKNPLAEVYIKITKEKYDILIDKVCGI